ncbi:glycosyltransferase family 2 protein [Pseudomonas sp. PSKL.D1]|uniref:glycosyltransferase family 2 protein n=1 Tax=Pseudomonas sp. PSKL.D1 TaxID=3029060 RepID=UPI00238161C8|nr:glycosyltransferase family 2 protein [Pseudomonas sp. PSKL.D1]WDY59345.1 glycosyltransferase family 2 protein [Pseudomonas sp. PSKL.D1]
MEKTALSTQRFPETLCLIVTYNPNLEELAETLLSLEGQVSKTLIVDNYSDQNVSEWLDVFGTRLSVGLIEMQDNSGLANAQNVGIAYALEHKYERILLLDQDSKPEAGFVACLHVALSQLQMNNAAAVGPAFVDRRLKNHPETPSEHAEPALREFLISSGMLIETRHLQQIGLMLGDLFIDHIDHEWCFRATDKGYALYQTPTTRLYHSLGDRVVRLWLLRRREISIHSAVRNYYKVRNSIHLFRLDHVPLRWKVKFMKQALAVALFSVLVSKDRAERLKLIAISVADGLAARLGALKK